MGGEQWYSNKELFEMFQAMRDDLVALRQDLAETRQLVRSYNGLREDLIAVAGRIDALENRAKGRAAVADGIRLWSSVVIGLAGAIMAIVSFSMR